MSGRQVMGPRQARVLLAMTLEGDTPAKIARRTAVDGREALSGRTVRDLMDTAVMQPLVRELEGGRWGLETALMVEAALDQAFALVHEGQ